MLSLFLFNYIWLLNVIFSFQSSVCNRVWSKMWFLYSQQLFEIGESFKYNAKFGTYPNIYRTFYVAFSIPIGVESCEQAFSSTMRIDTYWRSSMVQDRFTNCSIINIKKVLSNKVINDDVLSNLAQDKFYRLNLDTKKSKHQLSREFIRVSVIWVGLNTDYELSGHGHF